MGPEHASLRPAPGPGVLDSPLISLLFWILICFSIAALFTKRYSVRPLIVALILRSIYYLGIGPTLNILGALNVSARGSPTPTALLPPSGHCSAPPLVPGLEFQAHYAPAVGTPLCLLRLPGQLGRWHETAGQEPQLRSPSFRAAVHGPDALFCWRQQSFAYSGHFLTDGNEVPRAGAVFSNLVTVRLRVVFSDPLLSLHLPFFLELGHPGAPLS